METAERTSLAASTGYDGFTSYSHAADDLLAPRLQATRRSASSLTDDRNPGLRRL